MISKKICNIGTNKNIAESKIIFIIYCKNNTDRVDKWKKIIYEKKRYAVSESAEDKYVYKGAWLLKKNMINTLC